MKKILLTILFISTVLALTLETIPFNGIIGSTNLNNNFNNTRDELVQLNLNRGYSQSEIDLIGSLITLNPGDVVEAAVLNHNFQYLHALTSNAENYSDCNSENAALFGYDLANSSSINGQGPDSCILSCNNSYFFDEELKSCVSNESYISNISVRKNFDGTISVLGNNLINLSGLPLGPLAFWTEIGYGCTVDNSGAVLDNNYNVQYVDYVPNGYNNTWNPWCDFIIDGNSIFIINAGFAYGGLTETISYSIYYDTGVAGDFSSLNYDPSGNGSVGSEVLYVGNLDFNITYTYEQCSLSNLGNLDNNNGKIASVTGDSNIGCSIVSCSEGYEIAQDNLSCVESVSPLIAEGYSAGPIIGNVYKENTLSNKVTLEEYVELYHPDNYANISTTRLNYSEATAPNLKLDAYGGFSRVYTKFQYVRYSSRVYDGINQGVCDIMVITENGLNFAAYPVYKNGSSMTSSQCWTFSSTYLGVTKSTSGGTGITVFY